VLDSLTPHSAVAGNLGVGRSPAVASVNLG